MPVAGAVFGRVDLTWLRHLPLALTGDAEKAAFVAFSAGHAVAHLVDAKQDRIAVTIQTDFAHYLIVT